MPSAPFSPDFDGEPYDAKVSRTVREEPLVERWVATSFPSRAQYPASSVCVIGRAINLLVFFIKATEDIKCAKTRWQSGLN